MKVIEIINFNRELLKKLQEAGAVWRMSSMWSYIRNTCTGQAKERKYLMSLPCFLKNIRSARERFMPWLSGFGVTVRRLQYERAVLSGGLCCFSYL